MFAERHHLGIELGLKPINLLDGRPQIVDDQGRDHPAKMPQGILQPADEVLGSLPPKGLGVTLARVTQNHAQDMGTAPVPVLDHPSPLAKIDLRLLSRLGWRVAR